MRGDSITGSRPLARRPAVWTRPGILLIVSLSFLSCRVWGNDVVKVKVLFSASSQVRHLTDLTVVVGSDKYSWDSLPPGIVRSINLLPGPRDDRQVLFSYALDGRHRYWQGPKVDIGTGYEIEMTIDGAGDITARHCVLPCSLN